MSLPFKVTPVSKDEDELLKKYYKGYTRPFLRVTPGGYLLPPGYGDHAADLYHLEVRAEDIWVVTFSRSGTTWLQELVWLVNNNLDFVAANTTPLSKRFAFIEYPTSASDIKKETPNPQLKGQRATEHDFRSLPNLPSPRYVKSHLPLSLLPPNLVDTAKVFYVAREPRDVAVSYFFMHKLFRYFDDDVTFEDYWQLWKKNLLLKMPIISHVDEAWQKKEEANMMFLFYEEMQEDLRSVIDRVCAFLGREYTDAEKDHLARFLSFDNMKNMEVKPDKEDSGSELKFMRKGKSGTWVNYFNKTMAEEAEEYINKYLKTSNLRYPSFSNL